MLKITSGTSHPVLSKKIAEKVGCTLLDVKIHAFSDGEMKAEVKESVRGDHVFVIQTLCKDVNRNILELLLIIDALKRSSANVSLVIPYLAYSRQDKRDFKSSLGAKLISKLISESGASNIITMELHNHAQEGFFDIEIEHIPSHRIFIEHIKKSFDPATFVMVSPDPGGIKRMREYEEQFEAELVIINKKRNSSGEIEATHFIGNVKDKKCIIIDDIIDSGGTVCRGAQILKDAGAASVVVYATHAVLSTPDAIDKLNSSAIDKFFVTDTLPVLNRIPVEGKFEVLETATILADMINRIYKNKSDPVTAPSAIIDGLYDLRK